MSKHDDTEMGGEDALLHTTNWTELLRAQTLDPGRRRAARHNILSQYWKPIYCYLRRKGYDNDRAKDLTQGFFAEVVLGRDLLAQADQAKGKFRAFLLTALERYVASRQRAGAARKRQPAGGRVVSLEGMEQASLPAAAEQATPQEAFAHAWASALLGAVLAEVEAGCRAGGQEAYWEVFRERVLGPIMEGEPAGDGAELCERLGVDARQASNMVVTVKRRFGAALRAHLRQYVEEDGDLEAEIGELKKILGRRARS